MTTVRTFRNIRNLNKEIKVKHYDDGHYMWKQTMCFDNGVRNPIGASIRSKDGCYRRCHKATINEVLEDYIEVIDVVPINRKE